MEKNERKTAIALIQERGRNVRLIENASPKVLNRIKEYQNGVPIPSAVQYTNALEAIAKLDPAFCSAGRRQASISGTATVSKQPSGSSTARKRIAIILR